MAIEYELKYRATEEILQDMEQLLPGDGQVFQMHTTYYTVKQSLNQVVSSYKGSVTCSVTIDVRLSE